MKKWFGTFCPQKINAGRYYLQISQITFCQDCIFGPMCIEEIVKRNLNNNINGPINIFTFCDEAKCEWRDVETVSWTRLISNYHTIYDLVAEIAKNRSDTKSHNIHVSARLHCVVKYFSFFRTTKRTNSTTAKNTVRAKWSKPQKMGQGTSGT